MWSRGSVVLFGMFVAILVAVVAPASIALGAGGSSPEGAAAIEQARQAEAAGRVDEAVNHLERAYELDGDPELLFQLGELTSRLGQDIRALRLYRTYLTRDPGGKNHAVAELRVAALEQHLPASEATGAPVAPLPAAAVAPVRAPAAAPLMAAPAPVRAPAAAPAPPTPIPPPPAPASEPAGALTVVATQRSSPPIPRWVPWVGAAGTVGLAIAATVSGVSASTRYDDLRNSCGATAAGCSQGQIDDVRSSARRTTILWVGAGVLAAATGAAFYVNTREAGFSGVWRF